VEVVHRIRKGQEDKKKGEEGERRRKNRERKGAVKVLKNAVLSCCCCCCCCCFDAALRRRDCVKCSIGGLLSEVFIIYQFWVFIKSASFQVIGALEVEGRMAACVHFKFKNASRDYRCRSSTPKELDNCFFFSAMVLVTLLLDGLHHITDNTFTIAL